MSTADPHTMTGAYALDALDPEEHEAVRRHLAECPSCAQEVLEFSETAVRLGLAVAVTPTAALRTGVLERIATVRQEPPATRAVRAPRGRRGLRRWSHWALAACLAGAVGLGGVAAWQHGLAEDARQETTRARQANDAVAEVLAAPDARVSTSRLEGGAVGTVVVSASLDRAVFAASGMAPPPAGKVYQLWYDDEGTMRSAGLMDPGATAEATLLDGPVDRASGVGVTVEPAGGSPSPTSAPVAVLAFPRA
ncbi:MULTISPECIES: anti-sigma factor domain-containing protein [unclassified Streptomyces]|uniref:anti-sigma factor n=1 Tax=unclassified Streptomyces TaxID=2593676 RepID=UPI001E4226AC|nr:anti-sigma factor [Streptomyces sp. MBT42]MCD2462942.1 anti-sigma factor [Streptomyces sp. MBT42]